MLSTVREGGPALTADSWEPAHSWESRETAGISEAAVSCQTGGSYSRESFAKGKENTVLVTEGDGVYPEKVRQVQAALGTEA